MNSDNVFSGLNLDVFKITKHAPLMRKSEQYILGFFSCLVVVIGIASSSTDPLSISGIFINDLFFKYGVMIGLVYIVVGIASYAFTLANFYLYYMTTPIPLFLFFYNQYRMCIILGNHQYMFTMILSLALFVASAYFAGTLICRKK